MFRLAVFRVASSSSTKKPRLPVAALRALVTPLGSLAQPGLLVPWETIQRLFWANAWF